MLSLSALYITRHLSSKGVTLLQSDSDLLIRWSPVTIAPPFFASLTRSPVIPLNTHILLHHLKLWKVIEQPISGLTSMIYRMDTEFTDCRTTLEYNDQQIEFSKSKVSPPMDSLGIAWGSVLLKIEWSTKSNLLSHFRRPECEKTSPSVEEIHYCRPQRLNAAIAPHWHIGTNSRKGGVTDQSVYRELSYRRRQLCTSNTDWWSYDIYQQCTNNARSAYQSLPF